MYKEIKEITKHFSVYSLGTILQRVVGFLMIPIYTRYLSPQDYGVVSLISLISLTVSAVAGLHLSSAMSRFYYTYEFEEKRKVVSTALIFNFFIAALLIISCLLFSKKLSWLIFKSGTYSFFFVLALTTTGIRIINSNGYTCLRLEKKSAYFVLISLASLIFALLLNIFLIVILKMGVMGIFFGNLGASILVFTIFSPTVFRRFLSGFSLSFFKRMLVFSYPLISAGLLTILIAHGNQFLIKGYLGLKDLGIYSLAFSFGFVIQQIIIEPFGFIWGPFIYSKLGSRNVKDLISYVTFLVTLVAFSIFLIGTVFIKEIVMLIAGENFWVAYKIVPYILFSFCVDAFLATFDTNYYIAKKTKFFAIKNITRLIVLVIFNVVFLQIFGIMGAGLAIAGTTVVAAVLAVYLSERCYPVKYEWRKMATIVGLSLIFSFAGFNTSLNNGLWTIIAKLFLIFSFFGCLFLFKIITEKEIENTRKMFYDARKFFLQKKA